MIKKSISEIVKKITEEDEISSDSPVQPILIGHREAEQLSGGDRDYIPLYESTPLTKSTFTVKPTILFDGEGI